MGRVELEASNKHQIQSKSLKDKNVFDKINVRLTAAGRADVHDRQGWSSSRVGVGFDVAAPPRPPGRPWGLLEVRGEDAAATAGAGRLLGRAEADWRAETMNLRSASSRESLPPCRAEEDEEEEQCEYDQLCCLGIIK